MRARVSSQVFLMSSPLRPMMLPTLRTGTIIRYTQWPGQPGHLLSADSGSAAGGGSVSGCEVVPLRIGSGVAIGE